MRDSMTQLATQLHAGDALIVVDLQNDFLPGGALPVADGNAIVPIVNRLVERFCAHRLPIIFSRDWHPSKHCSFQAQGGPWPAHCVAATTGARFADGLTIPQAAYIVSKATDAQRDAYSAFQGTDLESQLASKQCRRVFVCGLATDYCVRATAEAALDAGFAVVIVRDAVRAVNVHEGDGETALQALTGRGAQLCESKQLH